MERAYRYRVYPNKRQKELIRKTFGCVRFVHNYFLSDQIEVYEKDRSHKSFAKMCRELSELKKTNPWLKEPDKNALQNALKDLDRAYSNYFREMKKPDYVRYSKELLEKLDAQGKRPTLYQSYWHPKYIKKNKHFDSYRANCDYDNYGHKSIEYADNRIKLPKLGWVKTRDKQMPLGRILNATISQVPSGKYYVSICCTDVPFNIPPKTNKKVGIDLGLKEFCVTSDLDHFENPKYLEKSLKKLAKLHRELDRKPSYGSNWEKARIKLARQYEKVTNQKNDYLNKLTTWFIREYDTIGIENLDIQDMIKNTVGKSKTDKSNVRRQIRDVSWYGFTTRLDYKAKWYDRTLSRIDTKFPSSQLCHICGYKNSNVKNLRIRKWICPQCGNAHNRDENAAINILQNI